MVKELQRLCNCGVISEDAQPKPTVLHINIKIAKKKQEHEAKQTNRKKRKIGQKKVKNRLKSESSLITENKSMILLRWEKEAEQET